MEVFFVFLFSFFFYVEGTVAINKDQAKVEGAAERNRKTRSCDNALECLFGLGSKQVRRSHGADVPNPPSGGGFISDGLDMLLTDLSESRDLYNCPPIYCPMDMYIPQRCRRPTYILGLDRVTRCRVCDTSNCGYVNVCPPRPPCPNDDLIPDDCRVPSYITGIDGRRCRMCDQSSCGYTRQK